MKRFGGFFSLRYASLALFGMAISLLSSCGSEYTTPVYNDPFFINDPVKTESLGRSAEPYQYRGDNFSSSGSYEPQKGESFDAFHQRVLNTLTLQTQKVEEMQRIIQERQQSTEYLRTQQSNLEEQDSQMRLLLAQREFAAEAKEGKEAVLFGRYEVVAGDTLQKISFAKYGTYTGWIGLYRFNLETFSQGPNELEVGTILLVPKINGL